MRGCILPPDVNCRQKETLERNMCGPTRREQPLSTDTSFGDSERRAGMLAAQQAVVPGLEEKADSFSSLCRSCKVALLVPYLK